MGIENILNIGSTGITANRLALEVASENIANVNTPGYSRQRSILETGTTTTSNGFPLGSGVKLAAVQRSYDALLQLQMVNGASSYNQSLSRQTALKQLEPLFNELTNNGIGDAMQQFFNSWHDLSVNPQGTAERQSVMTRARILVDNFQQMSQGLSDTQNNANAMLSGITADIADKAKNIATLNSQIRETELSGANANELRDQRELLIRQLSEKAGVRFFEEQDGTTSLYLPGGQELVLGFNYRNIYASNENPAKVMVSNALGNPPPAANATTDINVTATVGGANNGKGEIGGILQVRDSIIPSYQDKLNEMANVLAREVNTLHQAGYGLSSTSVGKPFFTTAAQNATATSTSGSTTLSGFASLRGISVGMQVTGPGIPAAPPTYVAATPYSTPPAPAGSVTLSGSAGVGAGAGAFTFTGVNSITFSVAITDLNDIAAAGNPPAGTPATFGAGNNVNALAIADLGVDSNLNFTTGNSSLAGFFNAFTSTVGVDLQNVNNEVKQGEGFLRQLNTLRESNSGVSLDEELTNLMKYQRAFQGSAKVLTTATEMLDTILGLVR
jgi:flagellar hook-associated protein 1 FlgK